MGVSRSRTANAPAGAACLATLSSGVGEVLTCLVCPHRCRLGPGQVGRCGARVNHRGQMHLLNYGRVLAVSLDPIEIKPLRHFRPGSQVYTIGTPGCTLACRFCQNWELSQTVSGLQFSAVPYLSPQQVVQTALELGAQGLAFSYTEPAAALEYALDVMRLGRSAGLFNAWHTNGFLTPEAVEVVAPWLDAACVDLKAADDATYRRLTGGRLAPVLAAARGLKRAGVWVEMSTPVLEGANDSEQALAEMAHIILETLGAGTPWHLMRGVPAWKMIALPITAAATLKRAADIGREAGLQRVHIGGT